MAKAATAADLKIKVGKSVKSIKSGIVGKVVNIETTSKGEFVDVNFGDKKQPLMRKARPSQLALA